MKYVLLYVPNPRRIAAMIGILVSFAIEAHKEQLLSGHVADFKDG